LGRAISTGKIIMLRDEPKMNTWDEYVPAGMLQKIHYEYLRKGLHSFSVISDKSGQGKTTVAMMLARGLKDVYGLNVLIVDTNPSGDALIDRYVKDYPVENGLVTNHPFPYSIFRIKDLDIDWGKKMMASLFLNQVTKIFKNYDIVIVDSEARNFSEDHNLLLKTQSYLIVSADGAFKEGSEQMIKNYQLNRENVVGVIYNGCV
jgi:cellulose biosynthesis protein BcsQ